MKFLDEFRDGVLARTLLAEIAQIVTRSWVLMEVCGGQTHSIIRHGLDQLLPASVTLIHGPGCPVCVTPLELIDKALAVAALPEVTFCTFGDMLRVPGSTSDLFRVKSQGGDVRMVYSPLDALHLARQRPDREVVFFGVGFETTAPANAMAIDLARRQGVRNFSMLVSHVLVPPALEAILASPYNKVQAFLAAGHVCTVMGTSQYPPISHKHRVPIVVTGFEPLDLLDGIRRALLQLESGSHRVENAYARAVTDEGNRVAQQLLGQVFEVTDRAWRGIGVIPQSGWRLRAEFAPFDAEKRFGLTGIGAQENPLCRSGEVLQGLIRPNECPAFGKECTPRAPLGATMVSSEGACAAYYNYGRHLPSADHISVEEVRR